MLSVSCNKTDTDIPGGELYYVNMFAYNTMDVYYLWNEEISSSLKEWNNTVKKDPITYLKDIRYKDSTGKDIDKWTMLTDDYENFSNSVAGIGLSFGFDFILAYGDESRKSVVGVVTLVYTGSPAEKAGFKRGDIFTQVNGLSMTGDNYSKVLNEQFNSSSGCTFTFHDGSTSSKLTAVSMYEDPVFPCRVFDCNGKKVGYLFYNSFTQLSYERLFEEFSKLKSEGVSELILDLRYNGGGYVTTLYALASMLAPEEAVENNEVFETEIYNKIIAADLGGNPTEKFKTEFSFDYNGTPVAYSTKGRNLGITKLYAIVTGNSASASESILTGLIPYMDVEIIGQRTYGKYCTGMILNGRSWFSSYKDVLLKSKKDGGKGMSAGEYNEAVQYTDNWGIYVMVSRYADKNGNTPCMPDGFIPDIAAEDVPWDGYQLGDPEETMLKVALKSAGYTSSSIRTKAPAAGGEQKNLLLLEEQIRRPEFGKLIVEPQNLPAGPISLR